MIVTIVRHGQAGTAATDEARELTAKGRDDIAAAALQLPHLWGGRQLPGPSQIYHSAWRRTTQTAQILAQQSSVAIAAFEPLLPGCCIADVDRGLTVLADQPDPIAHAVLVGHQPLVTELVDYYLGDRGVVPALPPGGLVCIELEVAAAGCGRLVFWAMPPEYAGSV